MSASPYKFLDFYDITDSNIFFGREKEIRILMSDITVSRLVVLFAKTGTGKTSLINAGVRPRLKERQYETFFIRVNKNPILSANEAISKEQPGIILNHDNFSGEIEELAKGLQRSIVLFFDQFEEFFIHVFNEREDSEKGHNFISHIAKLHSNDESGVHIVFSMREEWFGSMDAFRDAIPTIFHNESNLRLRWFDENQAREAMKRPAETRGVTLEEELVNKVIADISKGGAIEPAQLQIVCDSLWKIRKGSRITLEDYRQLGDANASSSIAEQVLFDRIIGELRVFRTEEELVLINQLLPELRTRWGTKYPRDVESLFEKLKSNNPLLRKESVIHVIAKLEQCRLLRSSLRDNLETLELAHDYLVERLDGLSDRVKLIWPERILRTANLISPWDLDKIKEVLPSLTLSPQQGELLFRSALVAKHDMALWHGIASANEVMVWNILEKIIDDSRAEDETVFNVIDLLVALHTGDAFSLLQRALEHPELAGKVFEALSQIMTVLAKEEQHSKNRQRDKLENEANAVVLSVASLLEKALDRPPLARLAEAALSKIKKAAELRNNSEVSSQIENVLKRKVLEGIAIEHSPSSQKQSLILADAVREVHYHSVVDALMKGRLVPFLGPGIASFLRPPGSSWQPGRYVPNDDELAGYLSSSFHYSGTSRDLLSVAQYVALTFGSDPLYTELRNLFNHDFPVTQLHRFFAGLPASLRRMDSGYRNLLIITTNYDDLMERAFSEVGEEIDVVTYVSEGQARGKFLHMNPYGEVCLIDNPNEYTELSIEQRSVILKLLGTVDRRNVEELRHDSFVITEDNYIDYPDYYSKALPVTLAAHLRNRNLLFLGCSLRHWAMRTILKRALGGKRFLHSWAIGIDEDMVDGMFWHKFGPIDTYSISLEEYVGSLNQQFQLLCNSRESRQP